ncbi:MAG: hypothetical protein ACC652_14415, partial [Acidimicrobiales bacterium]
MTLDLPADSRVYPPTNINGVRPDLKVIDPSGATLAWIEVELGTNPAQVADYESRFEEPIKTVFGKRKHDGDLSLEDVASRLGSERGLPPQVELNVQHLRDQIRQSLSEFSSSSSTRAEVSDEMKENPLVSGLINRLGDRLLFTTGSIPMGRLEADTVSKQGFSLRVNSRKSGSGTLSVLSISGGSDKVVFPPLAKLDRYLPNHGRETAAYAALLR